ncbi:hypothetical protein [Rosistilla oblonga]|uniref:hypothetical protein n=1 Tax=Rosistilla oblonga TaxID=2527990 RepID=UPI003A972381
MQLNAQRMMTNPIRCSGRASDGRNSNSPFAIVYVEVAAAADPASEFTIDYDEPECVDQAGAKYANEEEVGYFVSGAARGVKDAAEHYEALGVSLRGLHARIVKLVAHQVDSTERAFWSAAKHATAACLVNVPRSR